MNRFTDLSKHQAALLQRQAAKHYHGARLARLVGNGDAFAYHSKRAARIARTSRKLMLRDEDKAYDL